jgi:HAD superfamily hydrolase (TIGR01509 family)
MIFPRQIEAVVFDMDGLLLDTEILVQKAMMACAAEAGSELPESVHQDIVGRPYPEICERLALHFGPRFAIEGYLRAVRERCDAAFARQLQLKRGALRLLNQLQAGKVPCALCTSSRRQIVDRHLEQVAIADRFDFVVTGDAVTKGKPHPESYLTAAAALGVAPAACLALEDSHNGVRSAASAGMMTIMVPDLLPATSEMRALCLSVALDLHEVAALIAEHFSLHSLSTQRSE